MDPSWESLRSAYQFLRGSPADQRHPADDVGPAPVPPTSPWLCQDPYHDRPGASQLRQSLHEIAVPEQYPGRSYRMLLDREQQLMVVEAGSWMLYEVPCTQHERQHDPYSQ